MLTTLLPPLPPFPFSVDRDFPPRPNKKPPDLEARRLMQIPFSIITSQNRNAAYIPMPEFVTLTFCSPMTGKVSFCSTVSA